MVMNLFNLPGFTGMVKPANQNKMISRCISGRPEERSKLESHRPDISSSAWYHDAAVQEDLGRNFRTKQ